MFIDAIPHYLEAQLPHTDKFEFERHLKTNPDDARYFQECAAIIRSCRKALAKLIKQPGHDLSCVSRRVAFETEKILYAAKVGSARSEVNRNNAFEIVRDLYASLDITDNRLALDASALVTAFEEAIPDRPIQLRVDVCDTTTCPKFHHDHRYIRLVNTYAGPTTQYMVQDENGQVFNGALWELLLFKGSAHPTFSERVVHRSPPMTCGQRRLCLVIDC